MSDASIENKSNQPLNTGRSSRSKPNDPDNSMSAVEDVAGPAVLRVEEFGVPRLQLLMGEKLPRGSLIFVVGPPGSGKTTLASQIANAIATSGSNVITFTAFSEPTDKLIMHLRTFTFFDEQLLHTRWQVISLQQPLQNGLETTVDELVATARRSRAEFVVLDGYRGVRGAAADPQAARLFLYNVGTQLGVVGITVLVTIEANPHDTSYYSEATIADTIIGLHFNVNGVRHYRAIEVVKVRGSKPLPGLHGLRLTRYGLTIYPRLEAQIANRHAENDDTIDALEEAHEFGQKILSSGETVLEKTDAEPLSAEAEAEHSLTGRSSFGMSTLDRLLGGGLTRTSGTVVVGSPGTGKTLLALHYVLSGVQENESAVFLGMREDRTQLLRKADQFSLGAAMRAALAPGGKLTLLYWPPVELDPDVIAVRLLAAIEQTGARRVVIDSIGELERALARSEDPGRTDEFLAALLVAMRQRGITALYIKEHSRLLSHESAGATDALSVLAENVILMQHVSYNASLHRILSVVKMRYSQHDSSLHEFVIEVPDGIHMLLPGQSNGGVLEDITREQEVATRALRRARPLGTASGIPFTDSGMEQADERAERHQPSKEDTRSAKHKK